MNQELMDEVNYEIQLLIKSGFYSDDEILEIIDDEFIEENISKDINSSISVSLINKYTKLLLAKISNTKVKAASIVIPKILAISLAIFRIAKKMFFLFSFIYIIPFYSVKKRDL